jgi:hypothetical protein
VKGQRQFDLRSHPANLQITRNERRSTKRSFPLRVADGRANLGFLEVKRHQRLETCRCRIRIYSLRIHLNSLRYLNQPGIHDTPANMLHLVPHQVVTTLAHHPQNSNLHHHQEPFPLKTQNGPCPLLSWKDNLPIFPRVHIYRSLIAIQRILLLILLLVISP